MSGLESVIIAFAALFALLALRVPIAVAMLTVGMIGYVLLSGWSPLIGYLKSIAYERFSSYSLSIVPLFLLMGQFATKSGVSEALFRAASAWLGHYRGGIAMAAIGGCAGFGAITGSSLATAATMAQVALPEMKRYGYKGSLATGALAAGGTLGILIPPSIVLVIYAILTEQNIAKMFIAALLPGIIAALGYLIAIAAVVRRNPEAGPSRPKADIRERLRSLVDIWPVVMIFLLVVGGIYAGIFTPTEAAAVGAFATGLLALFRRRLDRTALVECLLATAQTTAMIFLIVLGADLFNVFLALTRVPQSAAEAIAGIGVAPYLVLGIILFAYLVLGCIMDSLSMILLTVPIFFPIVVGLDFGFTTEETAIWFGILALIVVEVGMITPPIGLNVYVIKAMAPDVTMGAAFKGVLPFFAADLVRIALLAAFPTLSLLGVWLFF